MFSFILSLSCFDERYSQVLLHLFFQDDPIDLDEVLSSLGTYARTVLLYSDDHKQPMWESFQDPDLLSVEIGKFLGKNSIVLKYLYIIAEEGLLQSCFLERTIMSGSFFIHQSTNEPEIYLAGARNLVKRVLIQKLVLLLKRGHCPRGALVSNLFPDLDWLKLYSPTKLARDLGVLELWREALVQSGHDASDIIDESLYAGIIDLFDGLSYQYSEWQEEEGYKEADFDDEYFDDDDDDDFDDDDDDDDGQKPGLVKKAAKLALTVVSSIV